MQSFTSTPRTAQRSHREDHQAPLAPLYNQDEYGDFARQRHRRRPVFDDSTTTMVPDAHVVSISQDSGISFSCRSENMTSSESSPIQMPPPQSGVWSDHSTPTMENRERLFHRRRESGFVDWVTDTLMSPRHVLFRRRLFSTSPHHSAATSSSSSAASTSHSHYSVIRFLSAFFDYSDIVLPLMCLMLFFTAVATFMSLRDAVFPQHSITSALLAEDVLSIHRISVAEARNGKLASLDFARRLRRHLDNDSKSDLRHFSDGQPAATTFQPVVNAFHKPETLIGHTKRDSMQFAYDRRLQQRQMMQNQPPPTPPDPPPFRRAYESKIGPEMALPFFADDSGQRQSLHKTLLARRSGQQPLPASSGGDASQVKDGSQRETADSKDQSAAKIGESQMEIGDEGGGEDAQPLILGKQMPYTTPEMTEFRRSPERWQPVASRAKVDEHAANVQQAGDGQAAQPRDEPQSGQLKETREPVSGVSSKSEQLMQLVASSPPTSSSG